MIRGEVPKPSFLEDLTGWVVAFSLLAMLAEPVVNVVDAEVTLLPEEGITGFLFVKALKKHLDLHSQRTGKSKANHLGHRFAHAAVEHVTAAQATGRAKRQASVR